MPGKRSLGAGRVLEILGGEEPVRRATVLLMAYAAANPVVFFLQGGVYHPALLVAETIVFAAVLAQLISGYSSYILLSRYLPVDRRGILYAAATLYGVAVTVYLLVLALPVFIYDPYGAVSAATGIMCSTASAALLGLGEALSPVMRGRPGIASAVASGIYAYVAMIWGMPASLLASLIILLASLAGLVLQHMVVVLRWRGG